MLYDFLKVNRNLAVAAYKVQKAVKGLNCTITEPLQMTSIFGLEDSLISYSEDSREEKLLVFNLFQEGLVGGVEFDAFLQSPYILTLWEEKLPLKSKVSVDFRGRTFQFVIDEIKSMTPHVESQLFLMHILVPAT